MKKYKKGDKVRVIKEGHNFRDIVSVINSVRKFKMPFKYFVDTPGFDSQYYTSEEIDPFTPPASNL